VVEDSLADAQALLPDCSCLVAHSGELIQAMGPAVAETANIPVVVPSNRVAEISHTLGYSNVLVANNALPGSMFEMVKTALR
jgi:uroporphyrinogen-III synthase